MWGLLTTLVFFGLFAPHFGRADDADITHIIEEKSGKVMAWSFRSWTHNATHCDPYRSSNIFYGTAGSAEYARLEPIQKAFAGAISGFNPKNDADCQLDFATVRQEWESDLRRFYLKFQPGVEAANCLGAAKDEAERRKLIQASVAALKESEAMFERILKKQYAQLEFYDRLIKEERSENSCHIRKWAGWLIAHGGVQDFSCEVLFARKFLELSVKEDTDEAHLLACLSEKEKAQAAIVAPAEGEHLPDGSDITGIGTH